MKVTIIGSGVAVPSLRRRSPGLVIEAGGERLLFDCGPDILRGLLSAGYRHQEIDRILITHFHPDHTLGLPHFLFASRYELEPRTRDILIGGPPGLENLLEGFNAIYPEWLEGRGYRVLIHEIIDNEWSGSGWKVRTGPVLHNPESIAYRLTDERGRSVVYSGDTGYCESLIELARGADLLVCECSFPDVVDLPTHLGPSKAGKIAARANVKKLLLTHFYPPCDEIDVVGECKRVFHGEVIRGEDGLSLEVS
ncbi:MAG: MBL fold metallo-hydrolase [Candidatus Euphemobacter frigidus]|nr:MBL fold metallo-hydrolase [Candidatus Euphemobacter frigidus]MDP8276801.1 MBL fold metallo-hydrolase [Candidatus Euphemobacter frigidus]